MGTHRRGFTLIEVVLFLGVTGLIMAVMLVGVGAGLNQQKYRDATNNLMSYVEDQYNLVNNVNNNRAPAEICKKPALVGRSDCTIVGRLLQSGDGSVVKSTQIIATTDVKLLPKNIGDTDAKVLQDASLTTTSAIDTYTPIWNTRLVTPGNHQPAAFSILIVRMPTSGVIHTYATNSAVTKPADFFTGANPTPPTADTKLCLDPNGLLGFSTQPAGTMITSNASNSSGVTFVSQGSC